jgi:hypothetical protein
LRIDIIELRRHDQSGHDGGAIGAAFGAGEHSDVWITQEGSCGDFDML